MTVRNLNYLFHPKSIAIIGADQTPRSIGAVLLHNLVNAGFEGPILSVNPHCHSIENVPCYPNPAALPAAPELAVIATLPTNAASTIDELGKLGTRAAILIATGFGESLAQQDKALQLRIKEAARIHSMRLVGPNCLGALVPSAGLNVSCSHLSPKKGSLAFVTQSGAIVSSVLDWAVPRGIGFSHLVSLGNMADVDFGDMLDYLADDGETRAILLYMEGITQARKFMSAARAASRTKPVIVVKAGRHDEGARAAASHTGALAGKGCRVRYGVPTCRHVTRINTRRIIRRSRNSGHGTCPQG